MKDGRVVLAVGWALSTFAAGLLTLDLSPLIPNADAWVGLGALLFNVCGGALYVAAGVKSP